MQIKNENDYKNSSLAARTFKKKSQLRNLIM